MVCDDDEEEEDEEVEVSGPLPDALLCPPWA